MPSERIRGKQESPAKRHVALLALEAGLVPFPAGSQNFVCHIHALVAAHAFCSSTVRHFLPTVPKESAKLPTLTKTKVEKKLKAEYHEKEKNRNGFISRLHCTQRGTTRHGTGAVPCDCSGKGVNVQVRRRDRSIKMATTSALAFLAFAVALQLFSELTEKAAIARVTTLFTIMATVAQSRAKEELGMNERLGQKLYVSRKISLA